MSDAVAVSGSAEIDYAVIDGSNIGAVIILMTEASAAADTFSKHKSAMSTKTEGQAHLDTRSKFKSAYHSYLEGCANLDTRSKFKSAMKVVLDRMGMNDLVQAIINKVYPNAGKYDYPVIQVITGEEE